MKNTYTYFLLFFIVFSKTVFSQTGNIYNNSGTYTISSCDTCASNRFYDSGLLQNYSTNENLQITFLPDSIGKVVVADFYQFETESWYDGLMIYNGPDTNASIISSGRPASQYVPTLCPAGAWHGTTSPGHVVSTHPTGALTFVFRSDSTVFFSGWYAKLHLQVTNYTPHVKFKADDNFIQLNGTVQFTDSTQNNPTHWQWYFPGGTPSSFIGQTPPPVLYDSAGTYNVSLVSSNYYGSD
jgi:PKD repeat protein